MAVPLDRQEYKKSWRQANPEKVKTHARNQHERLKREIVNAYGGSCECCGENDLHFLTVDHKNGIVPDSHRTKSGRRMSSQGLFWALKKQDFPDSVRILCWNCNCSHAYYGFCPHQPHTSEQRRYA